jgi:hypothetical protein
VLAMQRVRDPRVLSLTAASGPQRGVGKGFGPTQPPGCCCWVLLLGTQGQGRRKL